MCACAGGRRRFWRVPDSSGARPGAGVRQGHAGRFGNVTVQGQVQVAGAGSGRSRGGVRNVLEGSGAPANAGCRRRFQRVSGPGRCQKFGRVPDGNAEQGFWKVPEGFDAKDLKHKNV